MGFIYISDGIDDALALHLNQYADAWSGVAGKGQPLNAVAVNDPINFAISARNLDPTNSRACQFLKADGTVLFQCDASGVKVSPDGTVASVPVTATATQTLTNKTIGGAGSTAAGALGFSGTSLLVGDGTAIESINVGAWTTFTPTLTQGVAVTLSTAVGRYMQVGKTVIASVECVASSAGTAGQVIVLGGLPVAARAPSLGPTVRGHGWYWDVSPDAVYLVVALNSTSTSLSFASGSGGASSGFGVAPAVTVATSDRLMLNLSYEAA